MKIEKYILLCLMLCLVAPYFSVAEIKPAKKIDSLQNLLKAAGEDTIKVNVLTKLSIYISSNNPAKALNYGKQALALSQKLNFVKGEANACNILGISSEQLSDYPRSLDYEQQALKLYLSFGNKKGEAACLSNIGNVYFDLSDYPKGLDYLQRALNINREIGNKTNEAANLIGMGAIYIRQSDQFKAIDIFRQALKIHKELGNKAGQARCLGNIGTCYYNFADYPKAIDYFQQALKLNRDVDNRPGEGLMLGNLGNIYAKLNEYDKAKAYYLQAMQLNRRVGNKAGEASNLIYIGSNWLSLKNNDSALSYYKHALNVDQEIGYKVGEAMVLTDIAIIYTNMKDYPKAKEYLLRGLKISTEIGDSQLMAQAFGQMGELYQQQGNYPKAIDYVSQNLKISKEISDLARERDALNLLSNIYEKAKQPAREIEAYKQYIILRDSIMNVDKQKEITRRGMQFDFDTKEAVSKAEQDKKDAVANLELKNSNLQRNAFIGGGALLLLLSVVLFGQFSNERKAKRLLSTEKLKTEEKSRELEKSNTVKDKLFSIISHDLRSPLVSMDAAMKMVQKGNLSEEKSSKYISIINASVGTTINMLDNLLEWSLSNISSLKLAPGSIDIYPLVQEAVDLIKNAANIKHIQLTSDISENTKAFTDENVLRLVLRNLLSNAVKFTNTGGAIELSAVEKDVHVTLCIKDNGIGMTKEYLETLFEIGAEKSRIGTNNEKGSGLGLSLCNELLEKTGGKMEVESMPGVGTVFYVSLPMAVIAS